MLCKDCIYRDVYNKTHCIQWSKQNFIKTEANYCGIGLPIKNGYHLEKKDGYNSKHNGYYLVKDDNININFVEDN